jgi:5-methylcytosine-specific restriction endonuclease McrA
MRYQDIRRYLKPYSIVANRTTTINHAFAASIAPSDSYDEDKLREALMVLGQNPDESLLCAYCGREAETWDHVHATVQNKKFSGYGHRLGDLLPCCKPCNSQKGNKDWRDFLVELAMPPELRAERAARIDNYLKLYCCVDPVPEHLSEYQELQDLRRQVLALFRKADELAEAVRTKSIFALQR